MKQGRQNPLLDRYSPSMFFVVLALIGSIAISYVVISKKPTDQSDNKSINRTAQQNVIPPVDPGPSEWPWAPEEIKQLEHTREPHDWPWIYEHPLAFEDGKFYAPDPFDSNLLHKKSESGETWTPNGKHVAYIVFERASVTTGTAEGIAIRVTNTVSGNSVGIKLAPNESLTSSSEPEAGWPIYHITYDKELGAIAYDVYRRTAEVPWGPSFGSEEARIRDLIETRTIPLSELE